MSQIYACIYCIHADPLREKDGKIRCKRFSEWHDPIETVKCEGFFDKGAAQMMERVGRLKKVSILIKGMEMPTKENVVILINPQGGVWMIGDMPNEDTHLAKAKAVPVPPHGRLIDADALIKTIAENMEAAKKADNYDWWNACSVAGDFVMDAPTIIEAEEGET